MVVALMTLATVIIVMTEVAMVVTEADVPNKRLQPDLLKRYALSSAPDAGR
jgi:hypothetical protein